MVRIEYVKYKHTDAYKNHTFIVSQHFSPSSFEYLKALSGKIDRMFPDSYNPVYYNDKFNYCIIHCLRDSSFKFSENSIYDIEFDVRQKTVDDKVYVNCVLQKSRFIKRIVMDHGEIINF